MSLQRTARTRTRTLRDPYRGINDFKMGQQRGNNIVKDENGDLLADFHSILNRWKNYYSQLLNVHRVSEVRQKCIQLSRQYLILVLLNLKLLL
jgi:hypothetical protein